MAEDWKEADEDLAHRLSGFLIEEFGEAGKILVSDGDFDRDETLSSLTAEEIGDIAHNFDLAVRAFAGALGYKEVDMDVMKSLPSESETMRLAARMHWLTAKETPRAKIDPGIAFVLSTIPLGRTPS